MDYQIIRATPEIGQIEVLYKESDRTLGIYAIDVPVVDGAFLTGDSLHEEIMHRAPSWVNQREQEVAAATGFDQILALVQSTDVAETNTDQKANAEMWAQLQFEKQVAKVLLKFGVIEVDPTAIEVTQL